MESEHYPSDNLLLYLRYAADLYVSRIFGLQGSAEYQDLLNKMTHLHEELTPYELSVAWQHSKLLGLSDSPPLGVDALGKVLRYLVVNLGDRDSEYIAANTGTLTYGRLHLPEDIRQAIEVYESYRAKSN
jgi:hypothetical protein